jgi:hypothetical protein
MVSASYVAPDEGDDWAVYHAESERLYVYDGEGEDAHLIGVFQRGEEITTGASLIYLDREPRQSRILR